MIGIIQYIVKPAPPLFFGMVSSSLGIPTYGDLFVRDSKITSVMRKNGTPNIKLVQMDLNGTVIKSAEYNTNGAGVGGSIVPGVVIVKNNDANGFYVVTRTNTPKLMKFNDIDNIDWSLSITNTRIYNTKLRQPTVCDDNSVIVNYIYLDGSNKYFYGFCKLSSAGVIEWDIKTTVSDSLGTVPSMTDGFILNGYFYGGFTISSNIDGNTITIFKIDIDNGAILDQISIGALGITTNTSFIKTDGSDIYVVMTGHFQQNLYKLDENFNVIWQKRLDHTGFASGFACEGVDVVPDGDGLIYLLGIESRAPGYNRIFIVINASDGSVATSPQALFVTGENTYSSANSISPIVVSDGRLFMAQPANSCDVLTSIPIPQNLNFSSMYGNYANSYEDAFAEIVTINEEFFESSFETSTVNITSTIYDRGLIFDQGTFTVSSHSPTYTPSSDITPLPLRKV